MLNHELRSIPSRVLRAAPALAIFLAILLAAPSARAQLNTSGLRGTVTTTDGAPVAGALVTLVHVPSSNQKIANTNASGAFAFTGLRVGGPYSVTIYAEGYEPAGLNNIYLSIGKNESVAVTVKASSEIIEITDTAPAPKSTSARSTFTAADVAALPSVGRDPKDIVRLSPEVYTDGDDDAMSIGGANNRFNSVTIDGIRQDDDFGLNANGYPTQRSPIALLAVEEIAVETSPFDVRYGRFLGGNVNVVTKSGTNDLHGAVLAAIANDRLTGSKSKTDELELDFAEYRYGATLGGPIIKDKLHFFVSAEGLVATTPLSRGAAGSDAVNVSRRINQEEVDRVVEIANRVYGFDAGVPSKSLDERDLKLLAKVDWAINKQHRLSARYQRTKGNRLQPSFANDFVLPLTSNWYDLTDTLDSGSLRLFSDWTPQLSTEFEFSIKSVATRQVPLNGTGFMEAEIRTENGGTIVIGPDVFRHANKLDNDTIHAKAEANYLLGQHLITGGYELDRLSVFNLFVPFSSGEVDYASIDDFEAKLPEAIFYSNAISNNPDDAAANWGYTIHSLYLQDQFEITPKITAQGGVRFETYTATGDILENENFIARNGFTNTSTITGKSLVMPRVGLSFRPQKKLNLRGGFGLYSGGTPNVWISNNYTNDGVNIDSEFNTDPAIIANGEFNGRDIPIEIQQALMAGDGSVDALDPDFKIPSSYKASIGFDYLWDIPGLGDNGKNLGLDFNYSFSKVRHGLKWQDLRRTTIPDAGDPNAPVGTLPDGRLFYDNDDSDGVAFDPRRGFDMLLTNTDKGYGHTATLTVRKGFPFGVQLYGAYAFQNVKEVSPATSSRSVSNYGQAAVGLDPNDPEAATSNYERAHRFVGVLSYSHPLLNDMLQASDKSYGVAGRKVELLEELRTSFAVFFETRSGQPYSYTYGDSAGGNALAQLFGEEREFARRNRQLFYVPEVNDPNVILDGISQEEFDVFLEKSGLDKYRGQIAPRNAFRSPWVTKMDIRVAQDLPNPFKGHRAKLFLDIENFGNLLNKNWGRYEQVPFPYTVPVVNVDVDTSAGTPRYVYSNLRIDDPERVNVLESVWKLQISLMYEF